MATTTTKNCVQVLRGRVARLTRLDSCGRPALGPCSTVVTKGVIEIKISPEIEAGDEIKVKTFDGALCISDKACDQVKWWNVELTMCSADPDVLTITNPSYQPVLGYDGSTIGFMDNTELSCDTGYALEVWMQAIGTTNPCDQPAYTGVSGQWYYYALPWVIGGAPGDIDLKNDAVSFMYKGRTKPNSGWGVGPYPVLIKELGQAGPPAVPPICGPLPMPVPGSAQVIQFVTTMAPPTAQCGCQDTVAPLPMDAVYPPPSGTGSLTIAAGTIANAKASSGTIDWGDGTVVSLAGLTPSSTTGTCDPMGPLPTYSGATPAHTYACPGTYTITTTLAGEINQDTVTVGGALAGTGTGVTATKVATLATLTGLKQQSFTIDWKDGTITTYSAVQDVNGCWVLPTPKPTHTYTGATQPTITVTSGTESATVTVTYS